MTLREQLRWFRMKLRRLMRLDRQEAELEEELQFHFQNLVDEFRSEGLNGKEAYTAAKREFGHIEGYREEIWDCWRPLALANFWRSMRLSIRSLRRSPGFAVISILMLSTGVGIYTSIFSLLYSIMLKPLTYYDNEYLDRIFRVMPLEQEGAISAADFFDLRSEASDYGEMAAYAVGESSLAGPDDSAEYATTIKVSAEFFSVLRVNAQLGRVFRSEEMGSGNRRVLLISQRCWKNRFGGREDIIGRLTRVDGENHEIVGVLPEMFNDWRHLGWVDVFRPLDMSPQGRRNREDRFLNVIGRRSPTVSYEQAKRFFSLLGDRLASEHPDINKGSSIRATSLNGSVVDAKGKGAFGMIMGLSGCVLLIACTGLANLNMARTISRAREFAMRSALGATRIQALNSLIFESLFLAAAGLLGAILVTIASARWIRSVTMGDNGEFVDLSLDWKVFAWAAITSILTAVAFSLASALFTMKLDVNKTLNRGSRGMTPDKSHRRMQQVLVVGQFALALMLLAGAVLYIRGLEELDGRRLGWKSENLITGSLLLPEYKYPDAGDIEKLQQRAHERLESLPHIESVSFSWSLPFFQWRKSDALLVEGHDIPDLGSGPTAYLNGVSPDYFEAVGTPLFKGRVFEKFDDPEAPNVCIINESMAYGLFGNKNPIRERIGFKGGLSGDWMEVVGVVSDATSATPERPAGAYQLYRPLAQAPSWRIEIAARFSGTTPSVLTDRIHTVLSGLDPDLPIRNVMPASASINKAKSRVGIFRDMLSAFAMLGLGLASLGIYGVIARSMAFRASEYSIRIALGAHSREILRIGLLSGAKIAFVGSCIGVLGAYAISRILSSSNPGMRFDNIPAIVGSVIFLIGIALAASYFPARLATKTDLASTLRSE